MKIKPHLKEELKKYLLEKERQESEKITIVSAHKLSNEEWEMIRNLYPQLKGKDVKNAIDQSLLAGVIIKRGSRIIDLSLRQKLKSLEEKGYEIT